MVLLETVTPTLVHLKKRNSCIYQNSFIFYYLESLSGSRPVTPSQTTISPDDNDEGLYLLWTHQLLRERGFTPSSCAPDEYARDEHQDDDSSVSDMSSVSSGEEEEDDEEESVNIEHYIAEQRKLFSPAPSSYAYSHRDSMVSRYSNTPVAVERPQQKTGITAFFQSCFSSCL